MDDDFSKNKLLKQTERITMDSRPKNPFDFELSKVIVNDSVAREAVSRKEERVFLEFTKQDKHFSRYYEAIYILFKTVMRISEFCGLKVNNIDLKNKTVTIDHQLIRSSDMRYLIETPKNKKRGNFIRTWCWI